MATTTIRVDEETHARLVELSKSTGATILETVSDAAEALRRQRFGRTVAAELSVLRSDAASWDDYLADADSTGVVDGIG